MTAAQAAVAGDIPAPRICRKCSQPCRGHVGPTGKRCRNVSSPPLPPPEKVRASSFPQASLPPGGDQEEGGQWVILRLFSTALPPSKPALRFGPLHLLEVWKPV
jgi:hypothetical protein